MKNTIQEIKKEWEEKVNELRREIPLEGNIDSHLHEFGYVTRRSDELFKVIDFGNIWSFFEKYLTQIEKQGYIKGVNSTKKNYEKEPSNLLPRLHTIRASIPLSTGMNARKILKELIEELEK